MSICPFGTWERAIIIEQRDYPEWRGRPLAITNGEQGSCIIKPLA